MIVRSLTAALLIVTFVRGEEPKPTPEEEKFAAEAEQVLREGYALYQAGRTEQAIAKLKQVLELRRKAYPKSKYPDGHHDLATTLNDLGVVHSVANRLESAVAYFEEAVAMRGRLHPPGKFPNGHLDSAVALSNLSGALKDLGQIEKALTVGEQAVAMLRKLFGAAKYPDGHPNLAAGLVAYGDLLMKTGQPAKALSVFEEALTIRRKVYSATKFPNGHPEIAFALNDVGTAHAALARHDRALGHFEESVAMWRRLYPNGHPNTIGCLANVAATLKSLGHFENALSNYEECLELHRRLFPKSRFPNGTAKIAAILSEVAEVHSALGNGEKAIDLHEQAIAMLRAAHPSSEFPHGHSSIAKALNGLGHAYYNIGQSEKALAPFEQALAMRRKLFPKDKFPDGHADLIFSLNHLGLALHSLGRSREALPYYQQALAMARALYSTTVFPNGHPLIAGCLNNIGLACQMLSLRKEALAAYEQSLEIYRRLYPSSKFPDGHTDLATGLNNIGHAYQELGDREKALMHLEAAVQMGRMLFPESKYPDGHHQQLGNLSNLGSVLREMGQLDRALPYFVQSLELQQKLLKRELAMMSESAAFNRVGAQPPLRDAYLSITGSQAVDALQSYETLWPSRSMATRILEKRHAHARAAGTAAAGKLEQIKLNRRRIEQLLLDTAMSSNERDQQLARLNDERGRLERELVETIPSVRHWGERDALGVKDLADVLPTDVVFVDFVRYVRFDLGPVVDGKTTESRIPSYVAFVVAGRAESNSEIMSLVRRVELGPAGPIDAAVDSWRRLIDHGKGDAAGSELSKLLWEPLAKHLPTGTNTLYIAADSDLARVPWAALPIAKNRVLLENFAIALVPHGPFLLEQLKYPKKNAGDETALVVGGLEYNSKKWPALTGTAIETKAVDSFARGKCETVAGLKATAELITRQLPKAKYAHFATHGYFDAESLAAMANREATAMKAHRFVDFTQRTATKNPLGFVGLVLSNSEVVTGLSLVDLPLENLQLVTLSACETGLGENTGGEGVQGLQRAFHVAGCRNVIASLWKVSDAATAALMTKFYHELWVNKREPIEALRSAQLFIHHHPELIPDLSGERGAPKTKEALAVKTTGSRPNRADTKLWAAFVLSGVGR